MASTNLLTPNIVLSPSISTDDYTLHNFALPSLVVTQAPQGGDVSFGDDSNGTLEMVGGGEDCSGPPIEDNQGKKTSPFPPLRH